jgi:hypothetical protein
MSISQGSSESARERSFSGYEGDVGGSSMGAVTSHHPMARYVAQGYMPQQLLCCRHPTLQKSGDDERIYKR